MILVNLVISGTTTATTTTTITTAWGLSIHNPYKSPYMWFEVIVWGGVSLLMPLHKYCTLVVYGSPWLRICGRLIEVPCYGFAMVIHYPLLRISGSFFSLLTMPLFIPFLTSLFVLTTYVSLYAHVKLGGKQ